MSCSTRGAECPLPACDGESCLDLVDRVRGDLLADVDFFPLLFVSVVVPSRIHDLCDVSLWTGICGTCAIHSAPEDSKSTSSVRVSAGDDGASVAGKARACELGSGLLLPKVAVLVPLLLTLGAMPNSLSRSSRSAILICLRG